MALERATLYGLVVYSGRRVDFAQRRPGRARARSSSARRWSPASGRRSCRSSPPTASWSREVEELEHKSRRQDVLVDDELIYAFYDQQLPADVHSGATFERWYRDAVAATSRSCCC